MNSESGDEAPPIPCYEDSPVDAYDGGFSLDTCFRDLEQIAILLASGFESLLSEVESLAHQEQYLKGRLDFAQNEYRKLALNPTLIVSDSTNRSDVLRKFKAVDESLPRAVESLVPLDEIAARYNVKDPFEACSILKTNLTAWKTRKQGDAMARQSFGDVRFEHDFTSRNGTPSNLECPFAKMSNGNPSKGISDPIAAEFHGDGSVVSGTAYAQQNPNKCPIRYLDQHSPEEVTKYFENHKHEIPRSHAVCISRYQQNDAKIRQLDAKYGNLQNMIQSLGVKHQQYLPAKDREEHVRRGSSPTAAVAVEKWAENVSRRSAEAIPPPLQSEVNGAVEDGEQEGRTHHFERPLREIRLGESPSRPWGIAVPLGQEAAASAIPSDKGIEPLSLDGRDGGADAVVGGQKIDDEVDGRCPFGHDARNGELPNEATKGRDTTTKDDRIQEQFGHQHVIFNGPVFFGYSPDKVTALMQSGILSNSKI